jgi:hypothetical protein
MVDWAPLDNIEGRMQPEVATVAGTALAALGRVAYLVDDDKSLPFDGPWTGRDDRPRRRVRPSGLLARLRRPSLTMEATDDARTAGRLFEDVAARHDWSRQSQLAFVCDRATNLSQVSHAWIDHDVLGGRRVLEQLPPGVLAIAVPGVDGDYFGVVTSNHAVMDNLREAWSQAAAAHGLGWEVMDESTYLARMSRDEDASP